MRVLTVIAEMGSGGAESVAAQLCAAWTRRGDRVTLATSGGWRADALATEDVRIVRLPLRGTGTLAQVRSAWRLRRELRRRPVDVVHAHNVRAALAVRLGSRLAGCRVPVVCTVHGLAPERYRLGVLVLRRCADEVVAVSEDVADRLRRAGLPAASLRLVSNAADPARIADAERRGSRPDDPGARRPDLPAGRPLALCVARMAPPKRHDLLLQAWSERPGLGFLALAGEGPDRPALESRAAALGVAERVVWLGDQPDVAGLLAAADVLVLASDGEGMPVSVLEAMALGVPVVASAVGGLLDLPRDAVRLVPPGTAAALGEAVSDLLADPRARAEQVAVARALVRSRYSGPAMVAAYADLLDALGGDGGPGPPRCGRRVGTT